MKIFALGSLQLSQRSLFKSLQSGKASVRLLLGISIAASVLLSGFACSLPDTKKEPVKKSFATQAIVLNRHYSPSTYIAVQKNTVDAHNNSVSITSVEPAPEKYTITVYIPQLKIEKTFVVDDDVYSTSSVGSKAAVYFSTINDKTQNIAIVRKPDNRLVNQLTQQNVVVITDEVVPYIPEDPANKLTSKFNPK